MFNKRLGNVQLYQILADAYDESQLIVDETSCDHLLWNALSNALQASLVGARELVLVVDGIDEASCGEVAMTRRLHDAVAKTPFMKLVMLGSEAMKSVPSQTTVHVTLGFIFDDVTAVTRKILNQSHAFNAMSAEDQEMTVAKVTEASDGSFLWAKLTSKRVRDENPPNKAALSKAVDSIVQAGYKTADLISRTLQSKLSDDTKKILLWLATANRPLTQGELAALLYTQPDKAAIAENQGADIPHLLKPVASLVFFQS